MKSLMGKDEKLPTSKHKTAKRLRIFSEESYCSIRCCEAIQK